mmetsp:Transcript_23362/g.32728  ORF Transcript_23362/g.32728 Transcript_23362/m.32728 type:complete len:378 (+) Transcript_23362:202-1335(+)
MSAENKKTLEALKRLAMTLTDLNEIPSSDETAALSHWRELPEQVETSYTMMQDGASLVEATSTKYTLVGAIDLDEGAKLASDLLKGIQLIAAGAFVICNDKDHVGCSRSARHYARQSARSIVSTTISLIEAFLCKESWSNQDVGAQKTGAVWSSCQALQKMPKGNRTSMRRDLLTWAMECNETMQEFTEMVELGATSSSENQDDNDAEAWDDFCGGDDDQYTELELHIAEACVALIKCSRGTLNVALKACECAGEAITQSKSAGNQDRMKAILYWINSLFDAARLVGEGVTELGTLLYPPLELKKKDTDDCALVKQLVAQRDAIVRLHEMCLDATPKGQQESLNLTEEITELSSKLKTAAQRRFDEAEKAIKVAISR